MFLHMIIEVTLCRERLHAPSNIAMIRFLSCVNSQVRLQVSFLVKSALAFFVRTHKFLFSSVSFHMYLQSLLPTVRFVAPFKGAHVLFDFEMRFKMVIKVSFSHEALITVLVGAGKRSLSSLQRLLNYKHSSE